jgi:hypothetical protein
MFTLNNATTHEAEASLSKLSKAGLEHLTRRSFLFIKEQIVFLWSIIFLSLLL